MFNGGSSLPALLVFADDWGRHPSSCQHLVRHLLPKYEVFWVNTIGTRRPRLDLATLKRGLEKLRHWTRKGSAGDELPNNLHVLTPKMWPWFRSTLDRRINKSLLRRQLEPVIQRIGRPVVAITTLPIVADLVGELSVERWVYYCVDDFSEWPGLDREALQRLDDDLIGRADSLIAVSETLERKMIQRGRQADLLTHGVDLDFWQSPGAAAPVSELAGLQPPFVVFWGVVDKRMDIAFVHRLADEMKAGTIILVGPDADPDPALLRINRVTRILPVPYDHLPRLAKAADVLVMPYADLPVTRAMQPLKLKEYLATGRPTVVRDLPATREWSNAADLVSTPEEFSRLVRLRIETGLPESQKYARADLARESWSEKSQLLEQSILGQEFSFHATA
jgi:glycosyltransferase involved in cell wall biosynthesis